MKITPEVENVLTISSFIFGILSFVYAIYCRHMTIKAERKQCTIDWKDVNIAAKDLAKQIEHTYSPDIIYVPSIKSGIIVHFIKEYFSEYIPVITGQIISKKQFGKGYIKKIEDLDKYLFFETNKWYAYIPVGLLDYKEKKLLIIDDFAMSGDFLHILSKTLFDNGFAPENIKTSCLATTEVAIRSEKSPNYYWKKFSITDIYMPWGKPI